MTLIGLQSALAYVIRFNNEATRKNLDEIVALYDLSLDEKETLAHVAAQQRVKAYSEEMYIARYRITLDALGFLTDLVDNNKLRQLWEEEFDPKHLDVVYEDLVIEFTNFLLTDERGLALITTNTPAYSLDVVKYMHAVFTFSHNHLPKSPRQREQSHLSDRAFTILDLDHDVRAYCTTMLDRMPHVHDNAHAAEHCGEHELPPPPSRKKISLLFIASDVKTEFRSFEIDQELKSFLQGECDEALERKNLPPCFGDLVSLGLCKPLTL